MGVFLLLRLGFLLILSGEARVIRAGDWVSREDEPEGGVMAGEKDKAEGTWDETKGKVKEKAGEATGDQSTEAEGKGDQAKGKVKKAKGDVKEAGEKVKDRINEAFD
jgi:uncharacterized protein YjbJ (UPF0337 family)